MNAYNLSSDITNLNYIDSDGLLYNQYSGDQTVASLKQAQKEIGILTSQLRQKNKEVLILTDIRNLGKLNVSARSYAVEFIKHTDFDKVAIFGNQAVIERMVNFIIMASGRGYKMKYFTSEKAAKEWLLQ